jgi:hypothetical protein
VVAICDHLGFFLGRQFEHEVARKATLVALYLFVQPFGGHAIKPSEIGIEHDAMAAHEEDARGDLLGSSVGTSCLYWGVEAW